MTERRDMSDAVPHKVVDLEPKFFFGLTAASSSSCLFVNDEKIVYRAAGVLVIQDTSNFSQQFVRLYDAYKTITTMDFDSHSNLLAVAETGKKQPSVSVYNLRKRQLTQQLTVPTGPGVTDFIKLKFTNDHLHLAVLSGKPEYTMYYVNLKQAQVMCSVRVVHPPTVIGPVHDMALNPFKDGVCCFVGKGLFRSMVFVDSHWRQYGFHRVNKHEFTSVCWLNENRILAGTTDGRLFLVENGELKAAYNVMTLLEFDPRVTLPNPLNLERIPDAGEVRYCTPFKNGLAFVVNDYQIYYYKMKEDRKSFVRMAVFELSEKPVTPENEESTEAAEASGDDGSGVSRDVRRRPNPINTLCVSSKTAKILCSTDTRLYLTLTVKQPQTSDVVVIEPLGEKLHVGGVGALSVCAWKPWFMTCGLRDRMVKLWDHERRSQLLSERYPDDDVLDAALHPTGLHAVLAFRGRATFVTVHGPVGELTLRPRAEIAAGAGVSIVRFSEAGHKFAVVDGSDVHVHCSVTFDRLFTVDVHRAEVLDLHWANDDWELYTCDADGRVCQFDLYKGKHTNNVLFAEHKFQSLAVTKDLKEIYTASQDGRLRKIFLWTVTRSHNLKHGPLNGVLLSASNSMLFVTTQQGVLLTVPLPMESPEVECEELIMHNQSISKMILTAGDSTLITCSVDGGICLWRVKDADGWKPPTFPDDVIVSRGDVLQKLDTTAALESRLDQLTVQGAAEAAKLTQTFGKRSRELDVMRRSKADREHRHLKEAIAMHDACKTSLENEILAMKINHEAYMKTAKEDYEKRLAHEDVKYATLERYMRDTDEDMKKNKETMLKAHKERMDALADNFDKAVKEREDDFEKFKVGFHEDEKSIYREVNEFDEQRELDVSKLRTSFFPRIIECSKEYKQVHKEICSYKKRMRAVQKSEEDFEKLIKKYEEDVKNSGAVEDAWDTAIAEKEKQIQEFDEALRQKDATIHAKKLKINELKSEVSELQLKEEKQIQTIRSLSKIKYNLAPTTAGMINMLELMRQNLDSLKSQCNKTKLKIEATNGEIERVNKAIRENVAMVEKNQSRPHLSAQSREQRLVAIAQLPRQPVSELRQHPENRAPHTKTDAVVGEVPRPTGKTLRHVVAAAAQASQGDERKRRAAHDDQQADRRSGDQPGPLRGTVELDRSVRRPVESGG